ncbi:MAG: A/G-specific adenine glycosylase [Cyanobacteria bacterium]|nr:A/G-specific adenine glycosylase [Cyanobacteriota bacterium]
MAANLTDWYHQNARDLPWRNTKNPYHIWLSEIMLQQTQVVTEISYYQRFLKTFPTIRSLAEAPLDSVLKLWEGLGYYARCRNLHKAANQIMEKHGGEFPQTLEGVEALSGIGKSTAGAILTFAYDKPHPLLDGNVKRVLSRLFKIESEVSLAETVQQLWCLSERWLAESRDAYSFNQAIMELGAMLCTPTQPKCLVCPLSQDCLALEAGLQETLPVKKPAKKTPHYDIAVAVIVHRGRLFIQRRPEEGLLGGLWEFPGGKKEEKETIEAAVLREIQEELGVSIEITKALSPVKHAYTHFRITLYPFLCQLRPNHTPESIQLCSAETAEWVEPGALEKFAFPKANLKIFKELKTVLLQS